MRWLLLKDLQILRRSPLLVALLVIYPVVIAVLIGLSLSAGPGKPKVAFANLVKPGESEFTIGGKKLDAASYASQLFESIDPIRVATREEAIEKVRSGEALGALVLPEDSTDRLRRTLALSGGDPPTVEVYYNAEDPVKRRFVESTIRARLAEANDALSDAVLKEAAGYIDVIVTGGKVTIPLVGAVDILGLRRAQTIVEGAIATHARRARPSAWRSSRSPASPAWPPRTSTSPSRSWPRSARPCASSRPSSRAAARRWTRSPWPSR